MKKSRFSEQQIAFILKQAEDGMTVEEACRKAGISVQTYYRWRSKYGGFMTFCVARFGLACGLSHCQANAGEAA